MSEKFVRQEIKWAKRSLLGSLIVIPLIVATIYFYGSERVGAKNSQRVAFYERSSYHQILGKVYFDCIDRGKSSTSISHGDCVKKVSEVAAIRKIENRLEPFLKDLDDLLSKERI